jgi:hypothetical protein
MQGLQFNAIEDIEYLRNKLMAAFKVPKAFLGYEEDLSGKATLAAQDVRFARTIERVQRIVVSELMKIAIIHLYVQGFRDEELVNFEISLANSSTLYEQEKITIWRERFTLAQQMSGGQAALLSNDWIYKNIFEMSDDQIEAQRKMILDDMKRAQEQMAATQPPMPGGMPGMPGMPGEVPGGAPPGEELGSPEEPSSTGEPPASSDASDIGESPDDIDSEAEIQIDDIDQILNAIQDMEGEDDSVFSDEDVEKDREEELKEFTSKKKIGRPKEGIKFGTDRHHLGRDPLGHKENQKTYKRRGLSVETKNILDQLDLDKLPNSNKLDKKIII